MSWDRSKGRPEPIRALNRIIERDNGEPLVLLADVAPRAVILRPSVIPYLRLRVAEMLHGATLAVGEGYQIGVIDAWRPFERQVRIYNWMWANLQEAHPNLSYAAARRKICRFVAPVDQKAPPGHTTGAAVDVHLLDSTGERLDTTSPFKKLDGAPTYVYGLTEEARQNRERLVGAMLGAGFSNCRDEWWHYSYGDAGWAVRVGEQECCYSRIDLPEETYREKMDAHEALLIERGNPFLGAD
jgi:zinc D-Ala-D-Ala dipeptidase